MVGCVRNTASDYEFIKAWSPIFVGIFATLVAILVNWLLLKSKSREEERNEIYKKLNEFYGPFTQLRKKSVTLYRLFTKGKEKHYKTLSAILSGEEFIDNDKALLDQIISIDKQLEDLIVNKSGYVEDSELRHLLGEAAAHFNIMSLAYNKLIEGEVERFEEYLFPRNLDDKVDDEIKKLHKRLEELK